MKRFAKLLSLRLNKIYIAALIITALQSLISVIVDVLASNKYSLPLGTIAINDTNNYISLSNYSMIMALIAALLISLLVMHFNNSRYYIHLGIKKRENIGLSCANSFIMSVWVVMVYLISSLISTAIVIGTHNDYAIINSVYDAFDFVVIFGRVLIVFLACNGLCGLAMVVRKLFDWTKIGALTIIGIFIMCATFTFFSSFLSEYISGYIFSFSGSVTILAIINVIAFGGYALGEMLGEVKR